ncbi:hypothetical protein [Winogradskyella sp.]|uniref:hypothetical protein n=1 Tax=Winogradskyella sp. TaxID=1883156 RepID=UPI003BAA0EB3
MRNLAFILTLLCFYGQSSFSQNPIYYTAEETGTNSAGFNLLNPVGYWHISGPRSYENNNNLSVFWNDGSFKRYLTILDDGKVGIGTSSPTALLQVDGSTIFKPDVTNNNYLSVISNTSAQTNLLFYSNNTARWNLYSNNENFHFRKAGTNSSEVMLLDSQGNVGIGTTNPTAKLHVENGAIKVITDSNIPLQMYSPDTYSGILFADIDGNSRIFYRGSTGTFDIGGPGANAPNKKLHVHGGTSIGTAYTGTSVPTNGLAIEGEVGIGTANPNKALEIKGGDDIGLRLFNDQANFWDINNSQYGKLDFVRGGSDIFMRIDQVGRVGIGTTSPSSKLFLQQSTNDVDGGFTIQDSDGRRIQLFGEGPSGRQVLSTNTLNPLVFDLNGNERVRFTANGEVGIGTSNFSQNSGNSKLIVDGKILCEEVEVIADVVPDYVFQKYYTGASSIKADYTMPTLEEVEAFTKEYHHLPEVPSAKDIKEEGLQLKEMMILLLQKVEELTLYTIEQEKRIKTLEAELAKKE